MITLFSFKVLMKAYEPNTEETGPESSIIYSLKVSKNIIFMSSMTSVRQILSTTPQPFLIIRQTRRGIFTLVYAFEFPGLQRWLRHNSVTLLERGLDLTSNFSVSRSFSVRGKLPSPNFFLFFTSLFHQKLFSLSPDIFPLARATSFCSR